MPISEQREQENAWAQSLSGDIFQPWCVCWKHKDYFTEIFKHIFIIKENQFIENTYIFFHPGNIYASYKVWNFWWKSENVTCSTENILRPEGVSDHS